MTREALKLEVAMVFRRERRLFEAQALMYMRLTPGSIQSSSHTGIRQSFRFLGGSVFLFHHTSLLR